MWALGLQQLAKSRALAGGQKQGSMVEGFGAMEVMGHWAAAVQPGLAVEGLRKGLCEGWVYGSVGRSMLTGVWWQGFPLIDACLA